MAFHADKASVTRDLPSGAPMGLQRRQAYAAHGRDDDLWENFMGEIDPLRFENTDEVRNYCHKHNDEIGGVDGDTINDLCHHWAAMVRLDWLDRHAR